MNECGNRGLIVGPVRLFSNSSSYSARVNRVGDKASVINEWAGDGGDPLEVVKAPIRSDGWYKTRGPVDVVECNPRKEGKSRRW